MVCVVSLCGMYGVTVSYNYVVLMCGVCGALCVVSLCVMSLCGDRHGGLVAKASAS